MKREEISRVIGMIDEQFVAESLELRGMDGQCGKPERIEHMNEMQRKHAKKISRRMLLVAAVAALLVVSVLAVQFFNVQKRYVEPGETFRIRWDCESGFAEWTTATYVMEFEGAEECLGAEFKPGWLPVDLTTRQWVDLSIGGKSEGWYTRLTSEGLTADSLPEGYEGMIQPCLIELKYAPQFTDGGHLVLINEKPESITEETWGDVQVTYFHCSNVLSNGIELEGNYVILFYPREGWIVTISNDGGENTLEDLLHVARELEIRATEETIHREDFYNNNVLMNGGVG